MTTKNNTVLTNIKEKFDINKWLGWIAAFSMAIGWAYSIGKFDSRFDGLENSINSISTKMDKQEELMLNQQEFNGKVIMYIEIMENKNK